MNRTRMISAIIVFSIVVVAVSQEAFARNRIYHPGIGVFMQRDPVGTPMARNLSGSQFTVRDPRRQYADVMNLYQYASSNPIIRSDAWGLKDYKIGAGPKPDIKWDKGFAYNPNVDWTWGDVYAWNKYGLLLGAAQARGHLPNGTRAYRHYRDKTGTDLRVNYDNAMTDDSGIENGFTAELAGAQADIEREHDGKTQQFTVYSTSARLVNSSTEDWQKALGGHNIWGTGTVTYDPTKCTYTFQITVEMEDSYNFNKGEADIATGLPDDENGRFEVLGWAKSFYSRGQITRTVTWKKGEADKTTQVDGDSRDGGSRSR